MDTMTSQFTNTYTRAKSEWGGHPNVLEYSFIK